jgi:hypothetical protein
VRNLANVSSLWIFQFRLLSRGAIHIVETALLVFDITCRTDRYSLLAADQWAGKNGPIADSAEGGWSRR